MQLDPAMIIFAFLALFVLWRLRSVLGERTGVENKRNDGATPFPASASPTRGANDARWTEFAELGSPVWTGLDDVARAQPGFAPRPFLDGASSAYETVVQAFSRGDEAALHSLTSDEVFASFKGALEERSRSGETLETTFVGFNSVKIVEARVERPRRSAGSARRRRTSRSLCSRCRSKRYLPRATVGGWGYRERPVR